MAIPQKKLSNNLPATIAGIIAVIIWSTTIAFSKSVMETEGNYSAMFMIYFFGGILLFAILFVWLKKDFFTKLKKLPHSYYTRIGIFLLLNNTLLFIAIGLTSNKNELLIVTIINYLWPIITYIIKVPMFHLKPKTGLFIISIVLAISGVMVAFSQEYTISEFILIVKGANYNVWAYLLTLMTAVSWALYSNLTKKYHTDDDVAALPIIFIVSGLLFLLVQLYNGQFTFSGMTSLYRNYELIYMIICPTALAYLFWYIAMKKGNKNLVVSVSFLIPLLSIVVLSLKFSKEIGILFWVAALFLITGAFLSYKAVPEINNTNHTRIEND
jgi:drug/metabolite transporter (DMT)-like permease